MWLINFSLSLSPLRSGILWNWKWLNIIVIVSSPHSSPIILVLLSIKRVLYKQTLTTFNVLRRNNPSYLRVILVAIYGHLLAISSLLITCELFHLRVVTNTLPLLTGTIYRMTVETVALLAFLSVNLKAIFLALPILPSHVSPQRLRITFFYYIWRFISFLNIVLYCIVNVFAKFRGAKYIWGIKITRFSTNNSLYLANDYKREPWNTNQIKSNLFQATRPIAQTQMTIKHTHTYTLWSSQFERLR